MIELIAVLCCLFVIVVLGGVTFICVREVETNRTKRRELEYSENIEEQKTKRMVVQAQLDQANNEQLRLEIQRRQLELGPGGKPSYNPFDLGGS